MHHHSKFCTDQSNCSLLLIYCNLLIFQYGGQQQIQDGNLGFVVDVFGPPTKSTDWNRCSSFDYKQVFYSTRNARIASAVLAAAIPSVRPSVCPSVCLSVTRRYCVKTTAHSTVQFAPLDSKMCLVLYQPKNIPQG